MRSVTTNTKLTIPQQEGETDVVYAGLGIKVVESKVWWGPGKCEVENDDSYSSVLDCRLNGHCNHLRTPSSILETWTLKGWFAGKRRKADSMHVKISIDLNQYLQHFHQACVIVMVIITWGLLILVRMAAVAPKVYPRKPRQAPASRWRQVTR